MDGHHAVAFAAGAALGAGALYWYTHASQRAQQTAADPAPGSQQVAAAAASSTARASGGGGFDMSRFEEDDILQEQLTRNVQFFGLDSQKKIGGSFVVVVGLGVSDAALERPDGPEAHPARAPPSTTLSIGTPIPLIPLAASAAAAGRGVSRRPPAAALGRGAPAAHRF